MTCEALESEGISLWSVNSGVVFYSYCAVASLATFASMRLSSRLWNDGALLQ